MGPRLVSRGKDEDGPRGPKKPNWLQWGRDLLVAESNRKVRSDAKIVLASMGPRLVSRGKSSRQAFLGPTPETLQWGRDLLVAESSLPDHLQLFSIRASMGPRLVSRGKGCTCGGAIVSRSCFNGAATC